LYAANSGVFSEFGVCWLIHTTSQKKNLPAYFLKKFILPENIYFFEVYFTTAYLLACTK